MPVAADGMEVALLKREIGRHLRLARESIGFPIAAQFAREHGIASDKLNHWEKGKHFPDVLYVLMLWRHYRITADWIYLGETAQLPFAVIERLRASEKNPATK